MSRLTADQESWGDNGDPGSGEEDSIMWVNLAEGCGAVNDKTRRLFKQSRVLFIWFISFVWFV